MADGNTNKDVKTKKKTKNYPNKNYAVKKRLPIRPIEGDNVIFITRKTNFKVLCPLSATRNLSVATCSLLNKKYSYVQDGQIIKAQLDKCCDLLSKGEKEIILHGLGAAIQRCCNLALQLELLFSGTCQIEVNTGTVNLVDDLEPLTDDVDFGAQVRKSSSIHIRVFRTAMLGANQ